MLAIKAPTKDRNTSDSLVISHHPMPIANADEVTIKVMAAGVNRPDIMQRMGLYPPPKGASKILGLEVAGVIVALGDKPSALKLGDHVCALVTGGGYAEYCVAPAQLCLPIPESFNFIQAAALPETYFTVWSNIFDRARLLSGETILIHGGSSGIGTTAIQLAKAFDATVLVTTGSQKKCQFCTELGADLAINYRQQDFVEVIQTYTQNKGVNVVLDIIGGDYFDRNLQCLAVDARLIQIALQGGAKAEINLLAVMLKRLTITGSTLRARSTEFKTQIAQQLLEHAWPLLAKRQIQPIIHQTFPLAQAAQAHTLMESSQHMGKIILTV